MSAAWFNLCTAMFPCRIMHLWEKCFPTRPDMIGWDVFTPYVHQIVPVYLCHIHQVWTPPLDLNRHRAKHSPARSWVKMQTVSRCLDHRQATIPLNFTLLEGVSDLTSCEYKTRQTRQVSKENRVTQFNL